MLLSLIFGIAFGEIVWMQVKSGRYTVKYAKRYAWFFVGLNFTIALVVSSIANLEVAIILSNYALVIYNIRGNNNERKT